MSHKKDPSSVKITPLPNQEALQHAFLQKVVEKMKIAFKDRTGFRALLMFKPIKQNAIEDMIHLHQDGKICLATLCAQIQRIAKDAVLQDNFESKPPATRIFFQAICNLDILESPEDLKIPAPPPQTINPLDLNKITQAPWSKADQLLDPALDELHHYVVDPDFVPEFKEALAIYEKLDALNVKRLRKQDVSIDECQRVYTAVRGFATKILEIYDVNHISLRRVKFYEDFRDETFALESKSVLNTTSEPQAQDPVFGNKTDTYFNL